MTNFEAAGFRWVEVRNGENQEWVRRILMDEGVTKYACVKKSSEQRFIEEQDSEMTNWNYMREIPKPKKK